MCLFVQNIFIISVVPERRLGYNYCVLAYLRLWLSGEHKAWFTKPIRKHQSSNSHTILQSVADLMSGTQPMDQSKHSHQGHSSSQALRE